MSTWDVVPGIPAPNGGGGIWGYGGVSVDPATGHVLVATGADSVEAYTLYADRLVSLDGSLNLLGSCEPFHPTSYPCSGDPCDVDFGATPTVFQPSGCPTLVAAGNKNGELYLMRESDLDHLGRAPPDAAAQPGQRLAGQRRHRRVAGLLGGRADAVRERCGPRPPRRRRRASSASRSGPTASCRWRGARPLGGATQPDSTPTVAGGVVYVGEGNGGAVHAYDATTGQPLWQNSGPQVATYAAPIVANGTLFSGSWAGFGTSDGGIVRAYAPGTGGGGGGGGGGSTVLLGNQVIETQRDSNRLGQAEAFQTTGTVSGTLSSLSVYVDPSASVSKLSAGIYANNGTHPGALLAQASVNSPTPGAWATLPLSAPVTAGTTYWIALLGTGSGNIYFRDRANGSCVAEASSQTTLTTLPATWTSGARYADCPVSAYGSG